jgi:flagellar FliL protein
MPAFAADEDEPGGKVQYIEMRPSFVVNYGEPTTKMRYAKIDISLRVNSQSAAETVETHMPSLRNEIVLLLSQQQEGSMGDITGRESIRQMAKDQLNAIIKLEAGVEPVADLLFTAFVVQH